MSRTPEASGVEVDDRTVGSLLAYHALIEIRALAGKPSRQPGTVNTDEVLAEIRTLADRAHNLPLGPRPQGRWRSTRARRASPRERAMRARPMSYTWDTTGEQGRAWMLRHLSEAGYRWTPPPALPTAGEPAGGWSLRQLLRTLTGRRR
ncbi:hypothetical protein ACQP2Y_18405 [Actinoplanes sp. CA-051413]|uniref:hypothetical protein n=1 Tax=Actinoplanes sp. CA-051413 TaxID=3239899 RepID=UPI003D96D181